MNCTRAKDLLQLYLDGVLEPAEAQGLEAHVASCSPCRGDLVRMERLMLAIESLPRSSAPSRLVSNTMAAIVNRSPWAPVTQAAVSVGGLVAMLVGLFLAVISAGEAGAALAGLVFEEESPVALVDGLLAVAASVEFTFVAGIGLLLGAGCLTLVQLVANPGTEIRTS